jgi:cell division protease FtsH
VAASGDWQLQTIVQPPSCTPDRVTVGPNPMMSGPAEDETPPGTSLLLLVFFGWLFWSIAPKSEIQVLYFPWFVEQVESDNIKSITINGIEIHGELRAEKPYQSESSSTITPVRNFYTYLPSDGMIAPLVQKLTNLGAAKATQPVRIETGPPKMVGGLVAIMLLLPTVLLVFLIYLIMQRQQDRS